MLNKRSYQREWMDDLDESGDIIIQTLKELDYINQKLGGNYISLEALKHFIKKNPKQQSYSLVDLGCGGGDILIHMARWARKHQIKLQLTGVDANPYIIDYAREHCKAYPEISFLTTDIFDPAFTAKKFDLFHASLFTHHFDETALQKLFQSAYEQSNLGIIVNDLQRHWFAYYAIKLLTRWFSKSAMVQHDAAISVARGFHKKELAKIFQSAGISHYLIRWRWAFRWQVIIEK